MIKHITQKLSVAALFLATCLPVSINTQAGETSPPAFTKLTPRPPMGWNSYDAYHAAITEKQFRQSVDWLATNLLSFGWDIAVVDFFWFSPGPADWKPEPWKTFEIHQKPGADGKVTPKFTMDDYGRLWPATNRFPSAANGQGFKPLADYVHSKGMKFGIHIMRGMPLQAVQEKKPILGASQTCADIVDMQSDSFVRGTFYGVDARKPGAREYYDSLFQLYAQWGVDFIKADDMMCPVYHAGEIELMRQAIDRCGRPMVLSLSFGEPPMAMAWHLGTNANLWRVSADFWDRWPDLLRAFDLANAWSPFLGRGTWPDLDMIPIGRLALSGYPGGSKKAEHDSNFTVAEQTTLMSLWCIARSPLMWGGDPLTSSSASVDLLRNPEVLAVNQQSVNSRQIAYRNNARVWVADIPGSADKYFALFNLSDQEAEVNFNFHAENLDGRYQVRDLWERKDLGEFEKRFTRKLPPHGSGLFRLSAVKP
jgi:hypothetical protein